MTNPKYPVYVVSKGRHNYMLTSKSLNRMRVPHSIVVEPQEKESYKAAVRNLRLDLVTILVLPVGDHGNGPGLARNWAWDHSVANGAKKHWVLDDNILDFYRLNQNKRIRVETGICFKIMEDFVDRYINIKIAGPQYRSFCPSNQKCGPYIPNTRVYSCLLIDNECVHKWRGRYNEDTDICLRVLKDGDCTVQFNAFLQAKMETQAIKGGNTDEFYHTEVGLDMATGEAIKTKEKIKVKGAYHKEGTLAKSQMLVDMHPDVTTLVLRYGRWHHHVDYSKFERNLFKLKNGLGFSSRINNYGLRLVKIESKNDNNEVKHGTEN